MFSITILRVSLRRFILTLILAATPITSCDVQVRTMGVSTATPMLITATLPMLPTQTPTETPLPPPPTPTAAPAEGITSTQINVRAAPSTAGKVLGMLPANTKIEITGKDPGEGWWQIHYAQGVDGKGWVTAQYVKTATKPEVPTIGGGGQADPQSGNIGVVQQQLNVRSGPGMNFDSLGTLNAQDVVQLIGKDANGTWLQIDFPKDTGPEGKGWVNAAFVRAQGTENLPIVAETGSIVGTGTPTAIPLTVTPTVRAAWEDHDSRETPIVSVIFEPDGTQSLMYNGDISSPQGDPEDWIAFQPDGPFVFISLACYGSNSIQTEMTENSQSVNTYIQCGDQMKKTRVKPGSNYLIHVQAAPSTDSLQYTSYILTIKMGS